MNIKKASIILILALLVSLFASGIYALTANIGNARAIIRTSVEDDQPTIIDRTIRLNNVNDVVVKVRLYPDGDLESITDIIDNNVVLEPGESIDARFTLTLNYGGTYDGRIIAEFTDIDNPKQHVNMVSRLTILANGTENPNPNIDTDSDQDTDNDDNNDDTIDNDNSDYQDNNDNDVGDNTDVDTDDNQDDKSSSSSSFPIGMAILVTIIVIGLGVYFYLIIKA